MTSLGELRIRVACRPGVHVGKDKAFGVVVAEGGFVLALDDGRAERMWMTSWGGPEPGLTGTSNDSSGSNAINACVASSAGKAGSDDDVVSERRQTGADGGVATGSRLTTPG